MSTIRRIRAEVYGRVQGVGFRFFARQAAAREGLSGFVRNEADGSVTVEAQGPESALRRLEDALHHGPHAAEVRKVRISWMDATTTQDDVFAIR